MAKQGNGSDEEVHLERKRENEHSFMLDYLYCVNTSIQFDS